MVPPDVGLCYLSIFSIAITISFTVLQSYIFIFIFILRSTSIVMCHLYVVYFYLSIIDTHQTI